MSFDANILFNEVHSFESEIALAFIKSLNVQVYPCGRRRSNPDPSATPGSESYIPFDPEARLNTEANNRKYSSLNGFTLSYVKDWDETNGILTLVLGGYLFTIMLTGFTNTPTDFGGSFLDLWNSSNSLYNPDMPKPDNKSSIYANIRLIKAPLFSGFETKYDTEILHNQSLNSPDNPPKGLDFLAASQSNYNEPSNYYFSGLSFSTTPIANSGKGGNFLVREEERVVTDDTEQKLISLRILKSDDNGIHWAICEEARLPKIEHGKDPNSIKLQKIFADSIVIENEAVPTMRLYQTDTDVYQLQFFTPQDD